MKNKKISGTIIVLMLLLSFNACGVKEDDKVIVNEPGTSITIIEDADKETQLPVVSVEKIDRIEDVRISDWLDEETVVISKENDSLEKMSLAELSESYPRSLYLYNINTKEYKLLKEQKDVFLGEATLSADKKHLLYSEYTLGDPAYYVMNLDTKDTFGIRGDGIGGAMSASWFGNEVIGAAYNNGAFQASTSGEISAIQGLEDEAPFIVRATKDSVFYNTSYDDSLVVLNRATKEKTKLNLQHVYDLVLSSDGTKMLVLQSDSTKSTLILCDLDGSNQVTIAEGTELDGISWSPDQRMLAYHLKGAENNATVNGLYVYDTLTAKPNQIAVDIQYASTCWSPSGEKLVYSQWNGEEYSSSIVYLKSSLQSK
jgi:TolB protein